MQRTRDFENLLISNRKIRNLVQASKNEDLNINKTNTKNKNKNENEIKLKLKSRIHNNILGQKKSLFWITAIGILEKITGIYDFLSSNESSYIGGQKYLKSTNLKESFNLLNIDISQEFTPSIIEAIDVEINSLLKQCVDRIKQLESIESKSMLSIGQKQNADLTIHRKGIVMHLYIQLRELSMFYANQKKNRLNRDNQIREREEEMKFDMKKEMELINKNVTNSDDLEEKERLVFNSSTQMILEEENVALIRELSTLNDQVLATEKAIIAISELSTLLGEKIEEQASEIDALIDEGVASTEYVRSGNRSLNKALENQSSFRVIILSILIIASLSLLFLDWYSS